MSKVKDFEHQPEEKEPTEEELQFYLQTLYIEAQEYENSCIMKTKLVLDCIRTLRDIIIIEGIDESLKKSAETQIKKLIKDIKVEQG